MDTPVSASQRRVETLSVLDVLASGSSPSQDYTIFLNDGSTKHWAVRRSHQELFRFCQHLNDSYISNEIPRPSESFDPENTKAFLKSFPGQHQSILRDFLEIKEGGSDYEIPDPAKVLKSGQLQIFQGPRVHVILTQLRLFVFPQSALESSVLPKEAPIHDIIVSKSAALLQEKVKVVIKGMMNDIIFLAASESEAKAWLASFTSTCFAPAWFAKIGAPEREGIEAVKKLLKNENAQFIHRLSDMDILRFLREKGFDVEKTLSAIHYDQLWRKQFRSDYLTAANVYTHLKTSKFIFPGTFDKQSRPIIVFKAGRHDPNTEFMETLKLAIYAFEIAYKTLLYSNEVIVVEDLDGFDRDKNADNRMVKLLLEIVQAHFPERIGRFFAVNAPWYYKLLFKVVKPWLSSELAGKVSIATDPFDTLKQYVAPDQLIKDLGGSCVFDFNDWILQRCFEERVSPRLLENPPVHNIESDLLDCISDISVAKAKTNGLFEGWMKKQGGFVKNFNKRYCVLTPKILYYYKEENDPKAEGFMDLKGASVQKTGSDTFQVVTSSNKIGIFSCSSKHIAGWVTAIQQAISNIPLTLDPFDDYYDQDQDFYNPSFDKEIAPTPSVFPAVHAGRSEAFQIQPARAADEPEASDLEKKIGDVVWTARNGPGALAFADVYVDSKLCRSSFTGESLVVWMQKNSFASTSGQAADLCAQMINNESLRTFIPAGPGFNPAALYYFQEDVPTCFLNNFSWSLPVRSPQIVAASLAKRLAECVAKHTINGEIHQKWLANSRDFRDFKVATGELQRVNLGTLSPTQQTLFFLNIYNLLSLHAQIAFGTPTKYQARNFLISMSYNIGGRDFTLDDILHGILLGNSRALPVNPSRGEYSLVPVFGPGDDRAQFATRSLTNSQSVSIILGTNPQLWSTQPSNVFYDVEANVDEVLKGITEAYLTKGIMIDEANQKVLLPRAIQILRQRLCPVGGPKELFVQLQEACKPSTSPILDRFTAASPLFSVAFVPSPSRL